MHRQTEMEQDNRRQDHNHWRKAGGVLDCGRIVGK